MNYPDSSTVNTTAKKISFSPATRALIVGLALLLPGAAALAGEPIPGIDVKLGKNPGGGSIINAPTGADGAYQFKGLAAGEYDLSVGEQRVQTITVGDKGSISGVLSREPGGTASISVNGPTGIADHGTRIIRITNVRANAKTSEEPPPDNLPGAPVSTTRSNKKAGIAKAGEEPLPDDLPGAPVSTSRSNKKAGIAKAGEEANSALGQVSTTRGTAPGPGPDGGDVKPGISDQGAAGGLISYGTAPPPPKDGGSKAVESPVGFGRGNAGFGGTGPGMMGGGMAPPGPTMGGPMSPSPMGGGPMGRPGGAMGGAGAGRP